MSEPALALPRTHLPRSEDLLLWSPCLQSYGYRIVDKLFATRTIERGVARHLKRGHELRLDYRHEGEARSVEDFMDRNSVAGLLVARDGKVLLERYGLGLQPGERWSTMSTVKSMTGMLPAEFHPSRLSLGGTGYGFGWWLTDDGAMLALGHSGQRIYVHREERLVVVNLAVYPEPRYASAGEHDRDAELNSFIQACRAR
jgi:hypothetical protein